MLPKKRRVAASEFAHILQQGTTYHSSFLSLRINKITAPLSRFSVVVPKKVEKTAPKRNFLKRKVFIGISHILPSLPGGYSGIFFVKKGFSELNSQLMSEEIHTIIKKSLNISL